MGRPVTTNEGRRPARMPVAAFLVVGRSYGAIGAWFCACAGPSGRAAKPQKARAKVMRIDVVTMVSSSMVRRLDHSEPVVSGHGVRTCALGATAVFVMGEEKT